VYQANKDYTVSLVYNWENCLANGCVANIFPCILDYLQGALDPALLYQEEAFERKHPGCW